MVSGVFLQSVISTINRTQVKRYLMNGCLVGLSIGLIYFNFGILKFLFEPQSGWRSRKGSHRSADVRHNIVRGIYLIAGYLGNRSRFAFDLWLVQTICYWCCPFVWACTFTQLFLLPELSFSTTVPFSTIVGQYIVKNIVISAAFLLIYPGSNKQNPLLDPVVWANHENFK